MSENRQRKPYTGFGKMLRRLMWERDIRSWTQLGEEIFEATGERHSHQSMSRYASGQTVIPPEFVWDVTETLGLSKTERLDLAEQYAYHSRPDCPKQNTA